jgi:hypothetical protein
MKGRFLDAVLAAQRNHRSVALATDLTSGRQLLLDGERTEGDLALDEATLAARRTELEAAAGRPVHAISAVAQRGLEPVIDAAWTLVQERRRERAEAAAGTG